MKFSLLSRLLPKNSFDAVVSNIKFAMLDKLEFLAFADFSQASLPAPSLDLPNRAT